jgi:hypothetical protein
VGKDGGILHREGSEAEEDIGKFKAMMRSRKIGVYSDSEDE